MRDRIPFLGSAIISGTTDRNTLGTEKMSKKKSETDLLDFRGDYQGPCGDATVKRAGL